MQTKVLSSFIVVATLALIGVSANTHHNLPRHAKLHKKSASAALEKRASNGFGAPTTYYNVETGNEVACGGHRKNSDWLIAMNSADFRGGALCGKGITIKYKGQTQHAVVMDECPTCSPHGIDLSEDLFSAFAPHSVGEIFVDWFLGDAPEPEPKPEPKPSPTQKPDPPKTTSSKKWEPSSTSSSKKETKTSSSVAPAPTVKIPTGSNNIAGLSGIIIQLGGITVAGALA